MKDFGKTRKVEVFYEGLEQNWKARDAFISYSTVQKCQKLVKTDSLMSSRTKSSQTSPRNMCISNHPVRTIFVDLLMWRVVSHIWGH